jgi:hypothetical protein
MKDEMGRACSMGAKRNAYRIFCGKAIRRKMTRKT